MNWRGKQLFCLSYVFGLAYLVYCAIKLSQVDYVGCGLMFITIENFEFWLVKVSVWSLLWYADVSCSGILGLVGVLGNVSHLWKQKS